MSDEILLKILAASERTAAAVERLADIAEEQRHERKNKPAMTSEQAATRSVTREPKGDILTVTGNVLHFGLYCGRDGEPKTTKKGNQYWQLKLSSGFEAMVFSSSQAATCQKGFDEDRPLIVDYVISGKYSNIEDVRLGAGPARAVAAVEDDDEGAPF